METRNDSTCTGPVEGKIVVALVGGLLTRGGSATDADIGLFCRSPGRRSSAELRPATHRVRRVSRTNTFRPGRRGAAPA